MNSSAAIDFNVDYYKEVPMKIEADYKLSLSNDDNTVVKFAKIELDRLCKRILKSNKSLRGKRVTDKNIN